MTGRGEGKRASRAISGRYVGLFVSGLAGIVIAGLIFFAAVSASRSIGPLIALPGAQLPIFLVLFSISLVEIPLMLFALRQLGRSSSAGQVYGLVNAGYVAFAAVYASVQTLLFGESDFSYVLLALSLARWVSGLLIA